MKRCITTFADGRYINGAARLVRSLNEHEMETDFEYFNDYAKIGSPTHQEIPYAFKVYSILKCIEKGYDQILWLDSSMYAVRDLSEVWNDIDTRGYCLQSAGTANLKDWINDEALAAFKVPRWAVDGVTMFAGSMIGIDITSNDGYKFWNAWKSGVESFKGLWHNHRHDMAVGSLICFMKWVPLLPWNSRIQFDVDKEPLHYGITFKCKGI